MNGRIKRRKKPYFPNKWQAYKNQPDNFFWPHTFDEVMDFKVAGWDLPSNVACIIRTKDVETKKVKEYVYQRHHAADNKIEKLMNTPSLEICVCTSDHIHCISQHDPEDFKEIDF